MNSVKSFSFINGIKYDSDLECDAIIQLNFIKIQNK